MKPNITVVNRRGSKSNDRERKSRHALNSRTKTRTKATKLIGLMSLFNQQWSCPGMGLGITDGQPLHVIADKLQHERTMTYIELSVHLIR